MGAFSSTPLPPSRCGPDSRLANFRLAFSLYLHCPRICQLTLISPPRPKSFPGLPTLHQLRVCLVSTEFPFSHAPLPSVPRKGALGNGEAQGEIALSLGIGSFFIFFFPNARALRLAPKRSNPVLGKSAHKHHQPGRSHGSRPPRIALATPNPHPQVLFTLQNAGALALEGAQPLVLGSPAKIQPPATVAAWTALGRERGDAPGGRSLFTLSQSPWAPPEFACALTHGSKQGPASPPGRTNE